MGCCSLLLNTELRAVVMRRKPLKPGKKVPFMFIFRGFIILRPEKNKLAHPNQLPYILGNKESSIVAKGVKISTDQFFPPKNQHQKSVIYEIFKFATKQCKRLLN